MSCNVVVPKRVLAAFVALAFVLCLSGTYAGAQAVQPKNEIFVGYSWLHPNGYVEWGKVPDITSGIDASVTHYLPSMHNLGVLLDGSIHWNGGTNGLFPNHHDTIGIMMGGLQYKYHAEQFSPFARVLVGAAHLAPALQPAEWKPAVGGGGGFDLSLTRAFSIRLAQVDYIY